MSQMLNIQRSRSQLLTSYAPGTFFAFEGGTGAYKVYPVSVSEAQVTKETEAQIVERIVETASSWLERAMQAANDPEKPVTPAMCVDSALLNLEGNHIRNDLESKLGLVIPERVEYAPEPLTMFCGKCGLIRTYKNLKKMYGELYYLKGEKCAHPKGPAACGFDGDGPLPCNWYQLDVIFVHWSGEALGATPEQYSWNEKQGNVVSFFNTCLCGCNQFVLKRSSPRIGNWHFVCAECGNPMSYGWLHNDPFTVREFKQDFKNRLKEVHMEPVSFRATSVTYPQTDRIIDFSGQDILKLINDDTALINEIANRYGYERREISLSEIEEKLAPYPEEQDNLKEYKECLEFCSRNGASPTMSSVARKNAEEIYKNWEEKGFIQSSAKVPEGILQNIRLRKETPSKFDPFRLFAEHLSLEKESLQGGFINKTHKRHYVPFDNPDEDLIHKPLENKEGRVQQLLERMGVAQMGLIRKFKLCFFSFGYTRRHSAPVLRNNNKVDVPVRLCLFNKINVAEVKKHPVYVLRQENEAIYVQLSEEAIREYILSLGCKNAELFKVGPMGSRILENMYPMTMFLDNLPKEEGRPDPYLAVYTLLHTMAHHIIHTVSEFSGLDLGSLGEYIFPADLAFVIYRNGMTMDLGNLSAMWRNNGLAFLNRLLDPKSLSCGLGMLCENRGGACPDCIMVPEVTCIAQNKLLSRSVLKGGSRPREGGFGSSIEGFFDLNRNRADKVV
jgi:hypothetical protein